MINIMLQHPLTQYLCRVRKDPRVHLHHCKGLLLIDIQKLLQPEPALSGVSTYLFTKHIQTPRSVRSDICSKKHATVLQHYTAEHWTHYTENSPFPGSVPICLSNTIKHQDQWSDICLIKQVTAVQHTVQH